MTPASTAVIGGGWAGLSAVTRLIELGIKVTLIERSRVLGGRSTSFWDRGCGEWLDHGPHIFIGAYRESLRLLDLWGTSSKLDFVSGNKIPWIMADGTQYVFKLADSSAGALLSILNFNLLKAGEKLKLFQTLHRIQRYSQQGLKESLTLDRLIHEPEGSTVAEFFEALSLAVMNAPSRYVAARPLANALSEGLLKSGNCGKVGIPTAPLKEIGPDGAENYFGKHGVSVLMGCEVKEIHSSDGFWTLRTNSGDMKFDAIILAVPPIEALRLLPVSKFGNIFSFDVETVSFSSIMAIHCTFDVPVLKLPMAHLYQGKGHWVFGRGVPDLDGWKRVTFLISHAGNLTGVNTEEVVNDFKSRFPEARNARVVFQRSVRTVRATPVITPEFEAARPESETGLPGLFLAGDWCKTRLPATIESAARSGRIAAELLNNYINLHQINK